MYRYLTLLVVIFKLAQFIFIVHLKPERAVKLEKQQTIQSINADESLVSFHHTR